MNVVCAACGETIYDCKAIGRDYTGATIKAEDFVPLGPWRQPEKGENTECPLCGQNFFYNDHGGALLCLEGGGWWPHPPLKEKM